MTLEEGTTLFNVYAFDKPEELGAEKLYIGSIKILSKPVTTKWGDENLWF